MTRICLIILLFMNIMRITNGDVKEKFEKMIEVYSEYQNILARLVDDKDPGVDFETMGYDGINFVFLVSLGYFYNDEAMGYKFDGSPIFLDPRKLISLRDNKPFMEAFCEDEHCLEKSGAVLFKKNIESSLYVGLYSPTRRELIAFNINNFKRDQNPIYWGFSESFVPAFLMWRRPSMGFRPFYSVDAERFLIRIEPVEDMQMRVCKTLSFRPASLNVKFAFVIEPPQVAAYFPEFKAFCLLAFDFSIEENRQYDLNSAGGLAYEAENNYTLILANLIWTRYCAPVGKFIFAPPKLNDTSFPTVTMPDHSPFFMKLIGALLFILSIPAICMTIRLIKDRPGYHTRRHTLHKTDLRIESVKTSSEKISQIMSNKSSSQLSDTNLSVLALQKTTKSFAELSKKTLPKMKTLRSDVDQIKAAKSKSFLLKKNVPKSSFKKSIEGKKSGIIQKSMEGKTSSMFGETMEGKKSSMIGETVAGKKSGIILEAMEVKKSVRKQEPMELKKSARKQEPMELKKSARKQDSMEVKKSVRKLESFEGKSAF